MAPSVPAVVVVVDVVVDVAAVALVALLPVDLDFVGACKCCLRKGKIKGLNYIDRI